MRKPAQSPKNRGAALGLSYDISNDEFTVKNYMIRVDISFCK